MLARCEIRRRWRSTVALALLLGAVGAVILATAAGARRSDTALARFNTFSRSSDAEMSIGPNPTASQIRTFRRTPGVAAVAVLHGYGLTVKGDEDATLAIAAPADSAMGTIVDRARLIAGRRADPKAPDEITIGESFAAQQHLGIGDHLEAQSYTPAQVVAGFSGKDPGPPAGPNVRFRVVGIDRRPLDLGDRAASGGVVVLTPAFDTTYPGRIGLYTSVLRVRTQRGAADVPRVVAAARKLWGKEQTFDVQGLAIESEGAHNAIDVLTQALWIFAGVAALAGTIAIGIVLSRDIAHGTLDPSTLRGLGATRGQRVATSGARAMLIAGGGALLAGIGAVWLSPLFPVGLARRADPDVGLHADWLVLATGTLAIALVVLAIAFLAAWRATRPVGSDRVREARRRTSPVVELAARSGLRPTATNGLRMALQAGSGESAVPVRSAFAGAIFGIAGIAAVLVFAASLAHLVATPRLSGWTWDLQISVPTTPGAVCADANDYGLARAPGVEAVSAICYQNIEVDGRPVSGWGFRSLRGSIAPEVVAGRAPRGPGEIALGSVTLRALHKHIGDSVKAHGPNGTRNFSIVGRIVLPTIADAQPLADGASFTNAGLAPILQAGENQTHFVLVRMAPGADPAEVKRRAGAVRQLRIVGGQKASVEINRLEQINWFPLILAGLLATLALAAVAHALVTSVRRRRREIALLKTIGFRRGQVGAMVAWQATTLAVVGLVVGIPIGLLVGRAVWRLVADGLGISTGATLPALWLASTVVATLALVNLIAFFPARAAARTPPAVALRSE
jgi:hypothetical protein